MALSGYCKKCRQEVPAGELCTLCGSKLGTNGIRKAWCVERVRVRDWMCWNNVMRLMLPGMAGILGLILLGEWLSGGKEALMSLFSGTGLMILAGILLLMILGTMVCFLLQGDELTDIVLDGRGIHATTYLPEPTRLKTLTRLKKYDPAALMNDGGNVPVLMVEQKELAWKDVARVQLWPEKCMILFYAPAGWMRLSVTCTPFTWEDSLTLIREKLGKKKNVILPEFLRIQPEKKASVRKAKPDAVLIPQVEEAIEQITMEDMMQEQPRESYEGDPFEEMPAENQPAEEENHETV